MRGQYRVSVFGWFLEKLQQGVNRLDGHILNEMDDVDHLALFFEWGLGKIAEDGLNIFLFDRAAFAIEKKEIGIGQVVNAGAGQASLISQRTRVIAKN